VSEFDFQAEFVKSGMPLGHKLSIIPRSSLRLVHYSWDLEALFCISKSAKSTSTSTPVCQDKPWVDLAVVGQ
jgi:hypothetical protein